MENSFTSDVPLICAPVPVIDGVSHFDSYVEWMSCLARELTVHGETDYTDLIRWRLGWHWEQLEAVDRIRASMHAESLWMHGVGSSGFQLLDDYIVSMISSRESVQFQALAGIIADDHIVSDAIDRLARRRKDPEKSSTQLGLLKYRLNMLRQRLQDMRHGGRIEYQSSKPTGWIVANDKRGREMQILAPG